MSVVYAANSSESCKDAVKRSFSWNYLENYIGYAMDTMDILYGVQWRILNGAVILKDLVHKFY